jgi:hypothetical protein
MADRLPLSSADITESGSLNLPELSGPHWPAMGLLPDDDTEVSKHVVVYIIYRDTVVIHSGVFVGCNQNRIQIWLNPVKNIRHFK